MANSYWEKRSIDVEKLIQEKNDQTVIKVNEYFESVMKELNEQIRKIFNTYLTDSGMSIQEALKNLNTKQTRDAYNTLKRIYERTDDPDLKQEILNRIEALRDLIFCEAQSVGWYTEKMLQPRMIDAYNTSFYQTHYTIQKGTGLAYDFNNLSNPAVKAAIATDWKGSNYSKRIWKNTDSE